MVYTRVGYLAFNRVELGAYGYKLRSSGAPICLIRGDWPHYDRFPITKQVNGVNVPPQY
jgi:hypothetical protein